METVNEDNFEVATLAMQQNSFSLEVPVLTSSEPYKISSIELTVVEPPNPMGQATKRSLENMLSSSPRRTQSGALLAHFSE